MGPNIVTCFSCRQRVDATQLWNALSANNIVVASEVLIGYLTDSLTLEKEREYTRTMASNNHKLAILPSNFCKVCRQKKSF